MECNSICNAIYGVKLKNEYRYLTCLRKQKDITQKINILHVIFCRILTYFKKKMKYGIDTAYLAVFFLNQRLRSKKVLLS